LYDSHRTFAIVTTIVVQGGYPVNATTTTAEARAERLLAASIAGYIRDLTKSS
jgi:hypothetical protein